MIEFFRQWQTDADSVTHVTRRQNLRLHANPHKAEDVTDVTHVTHKNTTSHEAFLVPDPALGRQEDSGCAANAGYEGYKGYNTDSKDDASVTQQPKPWVTQVTSDNSLEWIAEHASILEFDGGLDPQQANYLAFMFWYRCFVEPEL